VTGSAGRWATIAALGLFAGCSGEPPLHPPPDTAGPVVQVLYPGAQGYDEDGDGFVDLHLVWKDSLGAVDVPGVRVRSLGSAGGAPGDTNLLATWRVEQLDSTGLIAHERLPGLLPSGNVRLEIVVPDTSGNVSRDTVTVSLPEAALIKNLQTGVPGVGFASADGLALCPDDGRLYVTVIASVWIVDPDSLRTISVVPPVGQTTSILGQPLCVPGDPYLYIAEARMRRFDRGSQAWGTNLTASFGSYPLALSRLNPDMIYEGELIDAVVGVINRVQNTRTQLLTHAPTVTNIQGIAILPGDAKLYLSYGGDGIWVVDPARDSVLKRIRVANPGPVSDGLAQGLVLSADNRFLYAAVTYGAPGGVIEIDTQTDSIVRRLDLAGAAPIGLDLSPDGRRLFVSTGDETSGVPSQNVLINVATMTPIRYFPRPRPPGALRFDRGVLFHPNGHYIFVTHDTGLDIYLNRP